MKGLACEKKKVEKNENLEKENERPGLARRGLFDISCFVPVLNDEREKENELTLTTDKDFIIEIKQTPTSKSFLAYKKIKMNFKEFDKD